MKTNEIQIGDWVQYDRSYPPSGVMKPMQVTLQDLIYIDQCQGDACVPIPLTPEILERNGLDKVPELSMVINRDTMPMYHSPMLHYVHELQHALRLCGLAELANNIKVE